jgi:hypothetical protein
MMINGGSGAWCNNGAEKFYSRLVHPSSSSWGVVSPDHGLIELQLENMAYLTLVDTTVLKVDRPYFRAKLECPDNKASLCHLY